MCGFSWPKLVAITACVAGVLASATDLPAASADLDVVNVPTVRNVRIDGDLSDWGGQGLHIETMATAGGRPWSRDTHSPQLRLGWTQEGLLAAVKVNDTTPVESDYIRQLFKGDSVEFFVSMRQGSHDRYMLALSPGIDKGHPQIRHCFFPDPAEENPQRVDQLTFVAARRQAPEGYELEVLLPWTNLGVHPVVGDEFGLQIYVMDADSTGRCDVGMWYPVGGSHVNADAVHRIRLSADAPSPVLVHAAIEQAADGYASECRIVATKDWAGRILKVTTGGTTLKAALRAEGDQAVAALPLNRGRDVFVSIDGHRIPVIEIMAADGGLDRARALQCSCSPPLPDGAFAPLQLSGSNGYQIIKATYYSRELLEVTSAKEPGIFGAVLDLEGRSGEHFRRFVMVPANRDKVESGLPSAAGHPSADALGSPQLDAANRDREQQFWVALKRKLYGNDKRFSAMQSAAKRLADPTRTLRMDAVQDTGITPDQIESIRTLCGMHHEVFPFTICLVRHGAVALHQAFGADEKPSYRAETPTEIYSMSKALLGVVAVTACDRAGISLDTPVADVLPSFKRVGGATPLTIRHLYTHMNGLSGEWGAEELDTEELLGAFCSPTSVGKYSYNGLGFAVGGKIVEQVSGMPLAQFMSDELLKPLAMEHTAIQSASSGQSTALDYAKLGQMVLNHGSYGNVRFFGEAAYKQLLPREGWGPRSGIGFAPEQGLSEGCFGHDAANSSMLWISPKDDLVLVIAHGGKHKEMLFLRDLLAQVKGVLGQVDAR